MMHCPFCHTTDTKVIDSRLVLETNQIRRRRTCIECKERFTTYEMVELSLPYIQKRDGNRVLFSEEKIRSGMMKALEKRPVSRADVDAAVLRIVKRAKASGERELDSKTIGEWVMQELKDLDHVAYVRFASVYRSFQDINAFREEIEKLQHSQNG